MTNDKNTNVPQSPVEEKTEYENFLDEKGNIQEKENASDSLGDIFGCKEQVVPEWQKHWQGMPEFEQEPNKPYKKIIVTFRSEEDDKEFAKLIGQSLTEKTKTIWHPKLEQKDFWGRRWVHEDEKASSE